MDERDNLSTADAVSFCRSCGGDLEHVALPGCKRLNDHPTDD